MGGGDGGRGRDGGTLKSQKEYNRGLETRSKVSLRDCHKSEHND